MSASLACVLGLAAGACSKDPAEDRGTAGASAGRAGGSASGSGGVGGSSGAGGTGGSGGNQGPNVDALLDGSCAKATVASELLPANILFVLDRSGSMACNPPPITNSAGCEADPTREEASEASKWEITSAALQTAIAALPANAVIGISYFSNDDACGVHPTPNVPLAANTAAQQSTFASSLGSVEPSGGTPLVGAVILAYKHMHEAALAGRIFGSEFVVLLTDGEQSEQCSDSSRCDGADTCTELLLEVEAPKASGPGVGIRTFVIGAPGSEPARSVLSKLAVAGGTARAGCDEALGDCHFDMTTSGADFGDALADALAEIAGRAITCDLPLPVPTSGSLDLELVNVIHSPGDGSDARVVPQDTTKPCEGGADGWQYDDAKTKIRVCGAACDALRTDAGARVDVVLGCPVQGPE